MEFAQNEDEFKWFLAQIGGVRSVLEIGSRFGESLYRIAKHLPPPARLLGVDFPNADDNPLDSERALRWRCREVNELGHQCSVIFGDSHDPNVIAVVRAMAPFDLLFIDGDHSADGVRKDWENYGPMAKVVAFHDIVVPPPCHVNSLWNELKQQYPWKEFLAPESFMGIGMLIRESNVAS